MFRIMLKVWIVSFALFFFGHIFFTDYVRRSIQNSLDTKGYKYLIVSSASLPFDTLIKTESEGSLRATMDGREIMLKFHVEGNPIWSRKIVVNVATPMARLRIVLGST